MQIDDPAAVLAVGMFHASVMVSNEEIAMSIRKALAAASLITACVAPTAHGAAITGGIGFGDGLETNMGLPTAIVVGLTSIDVFTPTIAAPCTGGFASLGCPTGGTAFDFSFSAADQIVFSAGSFDFHVTLVPSPPPASTTALACVPTGGGQQQCTDKFNFNGFGYVHDNSNTFQDTLILIGWSLTGNCIDSNGDSLCDSNWVATYAATITATGLVREVPEPTSLALIGLGLAGLGFARRRTR